MNNETEQIFILNPTGSQQSVGSPKLSEAIVTEQDAEDFSTVCRTCATVTEFVIPIFEGEGLQNNLADKINKHLPIQVSQTDVLPRVVCYQCASTLLAWHELVQCCVQADGALRTRLAVRGQGVPAAEPKLDCKEATQDSKQHQQNKSAIRVSELKKILSKIFTTSSVTDEPLDMELVCQKCESHPVASSVKQLAAHLKLAHSDISSDHLAVTQFVENFIVMQVTISEASDWDRESDSIEYPEEEILNFTCPFCQNGLSSIEVLMTHLDEHIIISKEYAVMCCDEIHSTKKAFVGHIQKEHANRSSVGTQIDRQISQKLKQHTSRVQKENETKSFKRLKHGNQKKIPVKCPECKKVLCNKYSLAYHQKFGCKITKNSTVSIFFGCPFCGSEFPQTRHLKIHLQRRHPEISAANAATCCGDTYTTKEAFYDHLQIHENSTPVDPVISKFNDYILRKSGENSKMMDTHIEGIDISSKDQKFIPATCAECGKILSNKYALLVHLKNYHSHLWDTDTNPVEKHYVKERRSLNSYNFFCPFCKSAFSHVARLLMHLNQHGDISEENEVKCCNEIFTHKKLFADHLKKDHAGRVSQENINMPNICKACGHKAETLQALQNHISQSHKQQEIIKKKRTRNEKHTPASCPKCKKVFKHKSSMLHHVKSQHSETPKIYACDKCDTTTTSQGNLTVHKRRAHDGDLKYLCSYCGEGFLSRPARTVHERVHTGARPFRCDQCSRAYRSKNSLDRHLDAHLDLRPYLCHLCPKKFRKISHLKTHLGTHKDA